MSRGLKLIKETKLDISLAQALAGKRVSFGELVAHTLKVNGIEKVEFPLSKLIDEKFFNFIDGVPDRFCVEIMGSPPIPIIADVDAMKRSLVKLFEVRHILVHELPSSFSLSKPHIDQWLQAVLALLRAGDQAFETLLDGHYPYTTEGIEDLARRLTCSPKLYQS